MIEEAWIEDIYDSLQGVLVPEARVPWVKNLFLPGSPCDRAYSDMLDAYERLRDRLGVADEDEDVEHTCTKIGENRYLVSGDMELNELFEIADIKPDEEIESNSVGGFIVEQLGDIPIRGQKTAYENITLTVKRVKNRRIVSASVEIKPKETD